MTTKLMVEGMSCGHCTVSVRQALEGISGVESAAVELTPGSAIVHHDDRVTAEEMVAVISEEGFAAKQVP
jgi:copper chaperone CopZ